MASLVIYFNNSSSFQKLVFNILCGWRGLVAVDNTFNYTFHMKGTVVNYDNVNIKTTEIKGRFLPFGSEKAKVSVHSISFHFCTV